MLVVRVPVFGGGVRSMPKNDLDGDPIFQNHN